MKGTSPFLRRFGGFLTAILLAAGVSACESSIVATQDDAAESQLSLLATGISSDLEMRNDDAEDVRTTFARHGGREPGFLWYVAADLQEKLTEQQKARLFELAPSGSPGIRAGGMHGFQKPGRRPQLRALISVLTEDQLEELKALHETFRQERKALLTERRNGTIDAESFREQARALRDELKAAIDALLTDEQRQQLQEMREEWRENHDGPGPHAAGEAAREQIWSAIVDALGLDADQQIAVQGLFAAHRASVAALIEEARTNEVDREAIREALADLRESFLEELTTVLTEKQLEIVQIHHALVLRMKRMHARHGGPAGGPGGRHGGGPHGNPSSGGPGSGSNG